MTDSIYPITLKLTEAQHVWLQDAVKHLSIKAKADVPMQAVIMRLMEYGAPILLKDIGKRSNSKVELQLVRSSSLNGDT